MSSSHRTLSVLPVAGLLLAAGIAGAQQDDSTAGVKTKGAVYQEDPRDLGATPAPGTTAEQARSSAWLDLNPYARAQFNEDWAWFGRAELFGSTGDEVVQNENDQPVAATNFAALRELYFEYGGITSFPGEVLRLGLQRVREPTGLWWDRDVESLRWIFDTTLVQAQLGVAEQFGVYRSDDVKLSPSQRDRAYAYASLDRQWTPGHFVGMRAIYAQDHGQLPQTGDTVTPDTKTQERQYLWVSVHTSSAYFDPRDTSPFQYWIEAIGQVGSRDSAQTNPADPTNPDLVVGQSTNRVTALAGDAGIRLQLPGFAIGGMAVYAQGDPGGSTSHVYQPTGLESNRSRFTGTRTLINNFNEALEAKWSNLRDAGGYVSLPFDAFEASAIYHRFMRDNGNSTFLADGIDARPVNDSRDIGHGYDLVLSHYFQGVRYRASDDEDARSNIRLRGSRFDPGAAYGDNLNPEYRVTLETTLWF